MEQVAAPALLPTSDFASIQRYTPIVQPAHDILLLTARHHRSEQMQPQSTTSHTTASESHDRAPTLALF